MLLRLFQELLRAYILSLMMIYQGCIFMTAVEGQVAGCCQVLFCFMVLHDDALLLVVLVLVFFLGSIISLAGRQRSSYCCCWGGAIIGDKKTMKVNARSGNKSPSQMHLDIFTAIRVILPTLKHYCIGQQYTKLCVFFYKATFEIHTFHFKVFENSHKCLI